MAWAWFSFVVLAVGAVSFLVAAVTAPGRNDATRRRSATERQESLDRHTASWGSDGGWVALPATANPVSAGVYYVLALGCAIAAVWVFVALV
jgi:hypothetical protein